jgi:hypothetical protein
MFDHTRSADLKVNANGDNQFCVGMLETEMDSGLI